MRKKVDGTLGVQCSVCRSIQHKNNPCSSKVFFSYGWWKNAILFVCLKMFIAIVLSIILIHWVDGIDGLSYIVEEFSQFDEDRASWNLAPFLMIVGYMILHIAGIGYEVCSVFVPSRRTVPGWDNASFWQKSKYMGKNICLWIGSMFTTFGYVTGASETCEKISQYIDFDKEYSQAGVGEFFESLIGTHYFIIFIFFFFFYNIIAKIMVAFWLNLLQNAYHFDYNILLRPW